MDGSSLMWAVLGITCWLHTPMSGMNGCVEVSHCMVKMPLTVYIYWDNPLLLKNFLRWIRFFYNYPSLLNLTNIFIIWLRLNYIVVLWKQTQAKPIYLACQINGWTWRGWNSRSDEYLHFPLKIIVIKGR